MLRSISTLRITQLTLTLVVGLNALPAAAKVIVLSNRTTKPTSATLLQKGLPTENITIGPGDSKSFFYQRELTIRYQESRVQREFKLDESNAYFFTYGSQAGAVRLEKIGLGAEFPDDAIPKRFTKPAREAPVIRVKLLVDDNEPTHPSIWEDRIRKRFAAAAEIMEQVSGIKLQIQSVATWDSDENITNFNRSLREFELESNPSPAHLAIGFSSQYRITRGRFHMGGTRGPLSPFILIKERSPQIRETERLELLVHELGHYFGAAHSPEPFSVMRPVLTGGQQRATGARIRFDPVNQLLIAMVGDEIRQHGLRHMNSFSEPKKKRLREIYGVLAKAIPDDPAAIQYQSLLTRSKPSSMVNETRQILERLIIVARLRNERESKTQINKPKLQLPRISDTTTQSYVRQAAIAAQRLKPDQANKAFLLALGVFLDDTATLRNFPPTSKFIRQVESETDRDTRLSLLDQTTMRGRNDLTKHFFVSAFLTSVSSPAAARSIGLTKELNDANQGSGFSFADMTANLAGIAFAEHLLAGKITLKKIAQNFTCEAYLPPIDNLPDPLNATQLQNKYGGKDSEDLDKELKNIEARIRTLPVYRQRESKSQ